MFKCNNCNADIKKLPIKELKNYNKKFWHCFNCQKTLNLLWTLLEHKVRYYVLDAPIIKDTEYDKLEKLCLSACKKYKIKTNLDKMVGAQMWRPCMQEAYLKVTGKIYV